MTEARRTKPRHLAADYAAQFGHEEVAAAYRHRPPYPADPFDRRYSAVVAAEAFHWLDWYSVVPRIAESLAPTGHLILVERILAAPLSWEPELQVLIREYSTNRDYVRYDTVTELEARGLLTVGGRAQTHAAPYHQPVDGYVESFHSRNGFSRARLRPGRAQEFDDKLRTLLRRHCPDDTVCLPVQARIVWGRPVAASETAGGPAI